MKIVAKHRGMMTVAKYAALTVALAGSVAAYAQESRSPEPVDIGEWAAKIQQAYPISALRDSEEGTVRMKIDVGANGRVSNCEVTRSSGSEALDTSACQGMLRFARYRPARDDDGNIVAGSISQAVRYVLPEMPTDYRYAGEPEPIGLDEWAAKIVADYPEEAIEQGIDGRVSISIMVDSQGSVRGCLVKPGESERLLQAAACAGAIRYARFEPRAPDEQYNSYVHMVEYDLSE